MTNAERIRSMTDEELINFLYEIEVIDSYCPSLQTKCIANSIDGECKKCWLNWLREEVNENDS